jgi:hypothetical protein
MRGREPATERTESRDRSVGVSDRAREHERGIKDANQMIGH